MISGVWIAAAAALAALAASGIAASGPAAAQSTRVVFGVTPWKDPAALQKAYAPVIEYLGQGLKLETVLRVAKDYKELSTRLSEKAVDIGFFSPAAYVETAAALPGLTYLVTANQDDGQGGDVSYYSSAIYVRKDSSYKSIDDLRGAKFGFTEPGSASGYKFPYLHFKKLGITPEAYFSEVFMLKKHDKIFAALEARSIGAGASGTASFRDAEKAYGPIFAELVEVAKIPTDAVAAAPHVTGDVRATVKALLMALDRSSPSMQQALAAGYLYPSFVDKGDSFYDPVREMQKAFAGK